MQKIKIKQRNNSSSDNMCADAPPHTWRAHNKSTPVYRPFVFTQRQHVRGRVSDWQSWISKIAYVNLAATERTDYCIMSMFCVV